MVKWLNPSNLSDYKHIGMGHGGQKEDLKYYSPRAGI